MRDQIVGLAVIPKLEVEFEAGRLPTPLLPEAGAATLESTFDFLLDLELGAVDVLEAAAAAAPVSSEVGLRFLAGDWAGGEAKAAAGAELAAAELGALMSTRGLQILGALEDAAAATPAGTELELAACGSAA